MAAASTIEVWKHVQEAYAGAKLGGGDVKLEFGVFLSPIGPENIAIKDQWTLSRSNLFFAFHYYHVGARLHVPVGKDARLLIGALNGYDGILDKNEQKTIQLAYHRKLGATTELDVQYFVGNERPTDAAEGSPLRHLLDIWVSLQPADNFWMIIDVDGGTEDGDLGRSGWASAGLWLRMKVTDGLFLATQSDFMREWKGSKAGTDGAPAKKASSIFWDVDWVMSNALCVERRFEGVASIKLEYRFDKAAGDLYYKGAVGKDPLTNAWVANADSQQTLTLAMTSWF